VERRVPNCELRVSSVELSDTQHSGIVDGVFFNPHESRNKSFSVPKLQGLASGSPPPFTPGSPEPSVRDHLGLFPAAPPALRSRCRLGMGAMGHVYRRIDTPGTWRVIKEGFAAAWKAAVRALPAPGALSRKVSLQPVRPQYGHSRHLARYQGRFRCSLEGRSTGTPSYLARCQGRFRRSLEGCSTGAPGRRLVIALVVVIIRPCQPSDRHFPRCSINPLAFPSYPLE